MAEVLIHTSHLVKCFPTGDGKTFRALNGINLDIQKGTLTILKGRSGSGKTTLLNTLSALDEPTEGEVECFGEKISGMTEAQKENLRRPPEEQVEYKAPNINYKDRKEMQKYLQEVFVDPLNNTAATGEETPADNTNSQEE